MPKPTAHLSPLHHRSAKHIKVSISNTKESKSLIRQVEGRKWSQTHRCWYVPYNSASFLQLKALFEVTVEHEQPPPGAAIYPEKNSGPHSAPAAAQFLTYRKDGEVKRKVVGEKLLAKPIDENWFLMYVPYDKTSWVNTIKNIEGRKWDIEKTGWVLPYVKSTFYEIKNKIGLQNVQFDFRIKKEIPEIYIPKKRGKKLSKNKKVKQV